MRQFVGQGVAAREAHHDKQKALKTARDEWAAAAVLTPPASELLRHEPA